MKDKNILRLISGEQINYKTKRGLEVYHSSLTSVFKCAVYEVFPQLNIRIVNSLMHGYYFEPVSSVDQLPHDFESKIEQKMHSIVESDEKFNIIKMDRDQAIRFFKAKKRTDKVKAIMTNPRKNFEFVRIRSYTDFKFTECTSSAGSLAKFRIMRYQNGVILQFPVSQDINRLPQIRSRERKLYRAYEEAKNWARILNVYQIPDLNEAIKDGSINTLIKVQEAFHEKKIALIADKIKASYPKKRVVFVAGPSASGKTTFLKRLGIQLRANGLLPEEINLDNYFVNRNKTPCTPDGQPDFECPEALDRNFFHKQIRSLLDGRSIQIPKYNFKSGLREHSGNTLKLRENSIILVEGIHGLNPLITGGIQDNMIYKIFINVFTQLCIDNDTRMFKSDSRLMRRIIRDSRYRNYSALETIRRFPRVRLGENKHIFPYQDKANAFFNSSIIYEQAVLKPLIISHLRDIKKNAEGYYEARRLLNYLEFLKSISAEDVPQTSILREFIGSSAFKY